VRKKNTRTHVPPRPRAGERGVALILVLVILPLVAIVLTQLHFEASIGRQLSKNVIAHQQFKHAIQARFAQMRLRLVRDLKDDQENQEQGAYDHGGDIWGPKVDGGGTALLVRKGDSEFGDEIEIFTEIIDEQGKFNINLLRHRDIKRRGKPFEVLTTLLDVFRDSQYGDMEASEWDLDEREAKEVATAIRKMLLGELEGAMVPKAEVPDPTPDLKQGVYTIEDLAFAHPIFVERRLFERFTDIESGQVIPSLSDFITIYGDGRINVNTAPIQVLRALFRDEEGRREVAERLLEGRGGFLETEEGDDERDEQRERRREAEQTGGEVEEDDELSASYASLQDVTQVEGMSDGGFLRTNDVDVARDFGVRTMFFRVRVSARRDQFLRQEERVFERHVAGCITWESTVRIADVTDLPEVSGGDTQE